MVIYPQREHEAQTNEGPRMAGNAEICQLKSDCSAGIERIVLLMKGNFRDRTSATNAPKNDSNTRMHCIVSSETVRCSARDI